MASDVLSSCVNDPNFTIICMFIDKFADACGINIPSINELSQMLENTSEVAPLLEEIHIKLLRKIKKTVPINKWENALAKFAYSYSNQDAWELERFGYKNSSIAVKLRVLKALLEAQFDRNAKFKGHINGIAAEQLRSEPIGRDKYGNAYWCILDKQCNVHIFCENLDDELWKVVASNREEVVQLIEKLKNNELILTPSQDIVDEDTSSNSISSHFEDDSATLKQEAKESSLIIERRVYKKADEQAISKKSDDKEDSKNLHITELKLEAPVAQKPVEAETKTNSRKTEESSHHQTSEIKSEDSVVQKPNEEEIKAEESSHHQTSEIFEDSVVQKPNENEKKAEESSHHQTSAKSEDSAVQEPHENEKKAEESSHHQTSEISEDSVVQEPNEDKKKAEASSHHKTSETSEDSVVQEPNEDEKKAEASSHRQSSEISEDSVVQEPNQNEKKAEASSHRQTSEISEDSVVQKLNEDEMKANENEELNDTVEEPVMLIKGEGSGVECEAHPLFSEVIEEPILYVYGLGDGIENQMGNIKTGEDTKTEQNVPKNLRPTDKNALPLKKKINRNYNTDDHRVASLEKSKDSNIAEDKTEDHSTLTKKDYTEKDDQSSKSSENKKKKHDSTTDTLKQTSTEVDKKDKTVKKVSNKSKAEKSPSKSNSIKIEKMLDPLAINEDTSNSSYEALLPKKENNKSSITSTSKKDLADEKHMPIKTKLKTEQKIPLKTETSTKSDKLNAKNTSLAINDQSSSPQKAKKGRRAKSGIVDGLDISQVILDKSENGSPPIRQSRRIAQQKIQEETNRRLIEEKMLRQMKAEAMKKKKENKQKAKSDDDDDDEDYVVSDEDSQHTESKVKLKKKNDKPWMNSSSESSSESEVEDYIEPEHSDLPSMKSDHEFSPESDLEEDSVVPVKRARTARVEKVSDDDNESIDSDVDHSCQKCGKADHPEWILLCDSCDKGYHCSCLVPVLFIIPEGDWFCPLCQHEKLISNLQSKLLQFDEYYEKLKADEALKKQIASEQNKPSSDRDDENTSADKENSDSGVLKKQSSRRRIKKKQNNSGGSSSSSSDGDSSDKHSNDNSDSDDVPIYKLRRRNTSNLSFKLNEYDNLIKSAIDRSTLESPESPPTHGKDIRNIVKAVKKEEEKLNRSHSKSPVQEKKKQTKNPLKKKKKLNSLDVSSEEDDGSDEDFSENISSSDDEESFSMTEDSESSLEFMRSKKSRAAARKRKDRDFINDDDDSDNSGAYNIRKRPNKPKAKLDDSDEFNEDDDVTESEEIDSDDLCNDTETDSSEDTWKKRKTKAKVVSRVPVRNNDNTKKKTKKADDDKTYKSGIRKRPAQFESDSDSSNKQNNSEESNKRRTRGKKLHYLIDDDFESSDDGITPGVHRPDTPPEEREKFIKKQEEIKRMLAEKNTAAAKELATPMIEPLHVNDKDRQPALSTIPPQVIESAKVLDIDFLRSSKHLDSDDFDEDLAVNLPDPDVNEEELAKIMEEEDFAQHQLKLDEMETDKDLSLAENLTKKKIRHFDSIDPTKITKPDKKIGNTGTVERKVDAVCSNLVNYLQSKTAPNVNSLNTGDVTENKSLPSSPVYHSLNPSTGGSSSLLQQMKQQAIPLHDLPSHPTSLILNSKKPFPCAVPPLLPTILPVSNSPLPATPTTESKDGVVDVRRRRRKKITPLRGDLYKAAMDGRLLDPTKPLLYPGPPPPAGVIHTDKMFPYSLPKQPSPTVAPTFVTNSTKPSDSHQQFPNPCPFIVSPGYNQGFGNSSSSSNAPNVSQPATSTLNEHPPRSFASLEPVNSEDPVTEQATVAAGNTDNSQNESEGTSEFSGLVSYFSSQQNELNA